jgi:glycerol-3-phosphate acyltransferase PlsY
VSLLLSTLAAYLIGSIPFAVLVGRLFIGRDIREAGSGHAGATNTMRQAGWGAGVLVLALDVLKGAAAVWLAQKLGGGPAGAALAGAAAAAGHCWPVFGGFRGGMGLATGGGAFLPIYPLGFVIGVGLLALGSLTLRHSARGNVAAGVLLGPVLWALTRSSEIAALGFAVGAVIALRALSNWRRVYRELWLDREEQKAPGRAAGPRP